MTTVRQISEELNVPLGWVLKTLMSLGAMKLASETLTEDEEFFIRKEAPSFRPEPHWGRKPRPPQERRSRGGEGTGVREPRRPPPHGPAADAVAPPD